MNNQKQNLRSKSGEHRRAEIEGTSKPQRNLEPRFISDLNPYHEQEWNQIPTHNPLAVMSAEESEDEEATPSVVKAPPTRLGFVTPPSGADIRKNSYARLRTHASNHYCKEQPNNNSTIKPYCCE